MFIGWPLKGRFNTNLHLQRVSLLVATEDSSDSVVVFSHAAVMTKSH